ncbi:hypothetical protein DFP73DRAFT_322691 [Morchella snyderi]|nr:hypothetical protein DFP73DRAFT_322691 [Morchella snyderi]
MQSSSLSLSNLLNDTQDTWPIDPGLSSTATAPAQAAEPVSPFRFVLQTPAQPADVFLYPSVSQTSADPVNVSLFRLVSQLSAESAESADVAKHLKVARASPRVKSTGRNRQLKAKAIVLDADTAPVRVKTSQWSAEERELLLEWLGRDLSHYEAMKLKGKQSCLRISSEIFKGSRSPESIRGQWELLKRKYYKARERLNSTGEGITSKDCQDRDFDKWTSMKLSCLNKICMHY